MSANLPDAAHAQRPSRAPALVFLQIGRFDPLSKSSTFVNGGTEDTRYGLEVL